MSAGMTVAAMVPSALPFLSTDGSFINCALLKARAPPGVDFVDLNPMAPARKDFPFVVRFGVRFLLGVFIGVSSSLCKFNVLHLSTIVPLSCSRKSGSPLKADISIVNGIVIYYLHKVIRR